MKFLLVVVVVGGVLWFSLRRDLRRPHRAPPRPAAPAAMVRCAQCGVHLPADEALRDGELHYCSPAHRALGPHA